jgi:hypothetical protein
MSIQQRDPRRINMNEPTATHHINTSNNTNPHKRGGPRRKRRDPNCRTMSVPEAGAHYLGLGTQGSYAAARAGLIPVIRIGRLYRVPVALMERLVNEPVPQAVDARSAG